MFARRSVVVLGALLGLVLLWSGASQAYVIFGSWAGNSTTIDADQSLPSSFFNAQGFGAAQWTNVSTSDWVFSRQVGSSNKLKYGPIDGSLGVLAVTTVSFNGFGTITDADVMYDSAENWYTGSGTPGPTQVDLRSVATHELGHVTGLDHTQSGNCPGASSDPTMCPYYTLGTTYFRSLATDDKDGLAANYPQAPALSSRVVQHALYPRLSDAALAAAASVAFVGRVESISPARWNSTDGARWFGAPGVPSPLAYHEVRFAVGDAFRGVASTTVTVTVLGASPSGSVDGSLGGRPDHGLAVGDRVLVLAAPSSLAWRDGSAKPILRFAGAPAASTAAVGSPRFAGLRSLLE